MQDRKFKHGEKRTWELILDAIEALGGSASRHEVRDWMRANHPIYNEKNLVDLEMLSVNSPSRTSYSQNSSPRRSNTGNACDRLFKVAQGRDSSFETYFPEAHGIWEIYPDTRAGNRHNLAVRQVASPVSAGLSEVRSTEESTAPFNPQNVGDSRRKVLAEICRRQGQSGFREMLCRAYENTCAITGCTLLPVLEAAHIHPYKGQHTNIASNGLLLRADIHTLFDLYLIAIDSPTMTTLIAPELSHTEYGTLLGRHVRIPSSVADRASPEALDWHRARCDW